MDKYLAKEGFTKSFCGPCGGKTVTYTKNKIKIVNKTWTRTLEATNGSTYKIDKDLKSVKKWVKEHS